MSAPAPSDARNTALTAAQRLARSRLNLLDYLAQSARDPSSSQTQASPWPSARDAARHHWKDHPLRLAAGLVGPLLSDWGRRHPLIFLGIAAGIGATLVIARPWKLMSVTGVLVAALKSSNLASLAMSVLAARRASPRDRGP